MSTGITVTRHDLNGNPQKGTLLIEPLTEAQVVRDSIGNIVFQGPLRVKLVNGVASVTLPPTDGLTAPTGFAYRVTEQIDGVVADDWRVVEFVLPEGTTVNLADIPAGDELVINPDYPAGGGFGVDEAIVQALIDATVADLTAADLSAPTTTEMATAIAGAIADLVGGAPGALDTLNELAAALADDADFAGTVTAALAAQTDALTAHTSNTSNPHSVTKSQVGLANVDNTSDADKPVSTATSTALGLKADATALTAHTSNTSNPHSTTKSQVGLSNVDNTSDANKPVSTAQAAAIALKADATALTAHTTDTANPHAVTKAQVGLANVDNTADTAKPVSTAQQTALNLKANLASPALTGTPTTPNLTGGSGSTQVTNKSYVDTGLATKADLVGGFLDEDQLPVRLAANKVRIYADDPGGGTNDQVALNATMAAVSAIGGGTVVLNQPYIADSEVTIPDNVVLAGESGGSLQITQTTGAGVVSTKTGQNFTGTIGTGSANLSSISAAPFATAQVGDFIRVPDAGYNGMDLIARIVTVTDSTHVVLDRTATAGVTNKTQCIVAIGNVNVGITNLRIFGTNTTGLPSGTNLTPTGAPRTGAAYPPVNLITMTYVDNLQIEGCELDHGWSMAMQLKGCRNVRVHDNYVHEIGRDGIDIAQNINPGHHISVCDNIVRSAGDDKIIVGWGSATDQTYGRTTSVVVKGNNLSGDQTGSGWDLGRGIVIAGCYVFNVSGNVITDTAGSGIWVREMVGNISGGIHNVNPATGAAWRAEIGQVVNNTIFRAGQNKAIQDTGLLADVGASPCSGVHVTTSSDVLVRNNLIRNSYYVDVWVASDCVNVDGADNNVVDANGNLFDRTELVAHTVATSNIALSGTQTIDGRSFARGELVLCVGQTDPIENGLWFLSPTSPDTTRAQNLGTTFVRALTMPVGAGIRRKTVKVLAGTDYAGSVWELTTSATPVVVGTSAQTWTQVPALKSSSVTSSATPTPTGGWRENELYVTALATAPTFAAPSGTPVNGNKLLIRVKDNGTARALAWNAVYQASGGAALPTTTVVNKTHLFGFRYDSAAAKWVLVASDPVGY